MADTDVGPGSGEMMMAVSTDKLIPGVLPPKEEQGGTDFLRILDDFDPSALSEDVLRIYGDRHLTSKVWRTIIKPGVKFLDLFMLWNKRVTTLVTA